MSAQTASAKKSTELVKDPEPVTPVIIKSGSGGGGSGYKANEAPNLVEIASPEMPFASLTPVWESSESTFFGRIVAVAIQDGALTEDWQTLSMALKPTAELVTVEIDLEDDQLNVFEAGDVVQQQVGLNIQSREVNFADPTGDKWTTAKATFDDKISRVTVMVGGEVSLRHDCKNSDVTVTIAFDRGLEIKQKLQKQN